MIQGGCYNNRISLPPKLFVHSNLAKSGLPMNHCSVAKSLKKIAQSTTVLIYDLSTETDFMGERDFARFEFKMSLGETQKMLPLPVWWPSDLSVRYQPDTDPKTRIKYICFNHVLSHTGDLLVSRLYEMLSKIYGGLTNSSAWASYQIRKIAVCACTGNAGNVFPATDFKENR